MCCDSSRYCNVSINACLRTVVQRLEKLKQRMLEIHTCSISFNWKSLILKFFSVIWSYDARPKHYVHRNRRRRRRQETKLPTLNYTRNSWLATDGIVFLCRLCDAGIRSGWMGDWITIQNSIWQSTSIPSPIESLHTLRGMCHGWFKIDHVLLLYSIAHTTQRYMYNRRLYAVVWATSQRRIPTCWCK